MNVAVYGDKVGMAIQKRKEGNPDNEEKIVEEEIPSFEMEVKTRKKPAWVKLKAFRYKEHVGISEDFGAGYRSKSDYLAWSAKDPLITKKFEIETINKIDLEIDQAIEFAKNSPFPELADLYTNVIQ